MKIVCFDMEGTLTPEIWQEAAKETNISELLKTTRDIPSFSELMDYRISLMKDHNISFSFLKEVASQIEPLDALLQRVLRQWNAREKALRARRPVRPLWRESRPRPPLRTSA